MSFQAALDQASPRKNQDEAASASSIVRSTSLTLATSSIVDSADSLNQVTAKAGVDGAIFTDIRFDTMRASRSDLRRTAGILVAVDVDASTRMSPVRRDRTDPVPHLRQQFTTSVTAPTTTGAKPQGLLVADQQPGGIAPAELSAPRSLRPGGSCSCGRGCQFRRDCSPTRRKDAVVIRMMPSSTPRALLFCELPDQRIPDPPDGQTFVCERIEPANMQRQRPVRVQPAPRQRP